MDLGNISFPAGTVLPRAMNAGSLSHGLWTSLPRQIESPRGDNAGITKNEEKRFTGSFQRF